jgi:hypothetical protein
MDEQVQAANIKTKPNKVSLKAQNKTKEESEFTLQVLS